VALPREVSAVPTRGTPSRTASSLRREQRSLLDLGPDTDYGRAEISRRVNERSLSQFEFLNTILGALKQTHYEDPAVLGNGPYLATVSWEQEEGGQRTKKIVTWQVDSAVIQENGVATNRVQIWFPQATVHGTGEPIRIQVKIVEAPTMSPDGTSYADYGRWSLVAAYDPGGGAHLAAEVDRDPAGGSIVKIHEFHPAPGDVSPGIETRGVLHRSNDAGAGRVRYPDWSDCQDGSDGASCRPAPVDVAYA
jgi:hypothetical protein